MIPSKRSAGFELGLLVVLLAVSLALRLVALDAFLTTDEADWRANSMRFDSALRSQDWLSTYQIGHPGVVPMWLGTAANRLEVLQKPLALVDGAAHRLMSYPVPAPGTGVPGLTLGARRLTGFVTWLVILALFPLWRKLFGARVALLATALVGLDPFLLAHSRLHHLDGLLTVFALLSVTSLLVYQTRGRQAGYLLVSAVAAGLAVATKSPGLILLPFAGLTLLLPPLFDQPAARGRALVRGLAASALWGAVAAATLFAVWPALWVSPLETLQKMLGVAQFYAETPHEFSNYFWFAARPDPGPFFYPVVLAFRTTPWVLLGLVGLAASWRRLERRGAIVLSLVWVLLFSAAMTVGEKKFDRYLLPVFPVLDVLAAVGWAGLAGRWLGPEATRRRQWAVAGVAAALAVAQLALLWPTRPYYISYYNPIVGGAQAAARVQRVGWGEGLDRAAAYLNAQPDAGKARVIVWSHQNFVPFFRGQNVGGVEAVPLAEADYYVFYVSELQRGLVPVAEQFVGHEQPACVVNLSGLDYAWVYRNTHFREATRQLLAAVDQQADPDRDLLLFDVDAAAARSYSGPLPVRVLTGGARRDLARSQLQRLLEGRQRVWHVTYTEHTPGISAVIGDVLEERGTRGPELSAEGVRAVRYDLVPDARFVPEAPPVTIDARLGQGIRLLGYEAAEAELSPGQRLRITLYWQATEDIDESYTVFVHLRDATGKVQAQDDSPPAGGECITADWVPGQMVLDEHELELPADAPAGAYTLSVGLYNRQTMQRLEARGAAGQPLPDNGVTITGWRVEGS